MKVFSVQIKWTNGRGFRPGQLATVVGMYDVFPEDKPPRLCYAAMYSDGFVDYVPVSDTLNYELFTAP